LVFVHATRVLASRSQAAEHEPDRGAQIHEHVN
jgi:hypothetical protein